MLPFAVLLELVALITGVSGFSVAAGTLFVSYFFGFVRRLNGYSATLIVLTVMTLSGLLVSGWMDQQRLLKAATDAGFYGAFLGSLGMMQCLVRRFEVLRRIHDVLLGGPPLWLYPKYAVTSATAASVLNFGVMNLLCGSLAGTLDERGITGEARTRWLRCVLISALRGFALVPLVAPTSVAVAIITREVPSLSWSQLLPFGLVTGALLIAVGWLLEYSRFRQVSEERVKLEGWPPGTGRLVIVVLIMFALMAALVFGASLNVSRSAMLAVPGVTLLYMIWHDRSLRGAVAEAADNVNAMRNEMAIFAASGALGAALSSLVPTDLISGLVASQAGIYWVAVCGLLILPLMSAVGVIPITMLSIFSGLLPQLMNAGMDPLL
ncbi:MAG: hypothetical protein R3303_15045, partial [Marinobacter sp.]|nr:hypothetical protein [Marinobacter sp.]